MYAFNFTRVDYQWATSLLATHQGLSSVEFIGKQNARYVTDPDSWRAVPPVRFGREPDKAPNTDE